MRALARAQAEWGLQSGHLFLWSPVCYGAGIATYFALRFEPDRTFWQAVGVTVVLAALAYWRLSFSVRPIAMAVLLFALGFAVAGSKAHRVADTPLSFRFYGAIEGRIVKVDRSASDAVRLTLDRVRLQDVDLRRTPGRVRIALHGTQGFLDPEPGVTVILTGHLSPPGGAVEPGGYDFRRHAWFQGIGAVGYTRTPVLALAPHQGRDVALWIYRFRMALSSAVQEALPGRVGAFAAAITTGDRSGMERETYDALRASNLAHLLAISGLHMGLLTGFVFSALRVGLIALPRAALHWPIRKLAAIGALAAGAVYLALSGGNVATERAYIMVAVMFVGVLCDRRAITLRAVAVAAMIVLTLRPEALYGPGFQMSFAATTALVAVFGAFRSGGVHVKHWPKWVRFVGGVALSSFIAGMATAPIGAAHFNQVPHYGIVANVVSIPLMGAVIIPAAVLAAVLSPFGLGWIGLKIMAPAISWILLVAEQVSSWDGAVSHVIAPGPAVLPILALGVLILALWRGAGRAFGVPVAATAVVLWALTERPPVLISETGGLVGVMTSEGRALSKPKGDGFAASSWLENDGDPALREVASARIAFEEQGRQRRFAIGDVDVLHATGKTAAAAALAECGKVALIIVNVPLSGPKGCPIYDRARLRRSGSLALYPEGVGLRIVEAQAYAGARLWSGARRARED